MSEYPEFEVIQNWEDLLGKTIVKLEKWGETVYLRLEQNGQAYIATLQGGAAWDSDYLSLLECIPSDDVLVELDLLASEEFARRREEEARIYEEQLLEQRREQYERLKKELGYV